MNAQENSYKLLSTSHFPQLETNFAQVQKSWDTNEILQMLQAQAPNLAVYDEALGFAHLQVPETISFGKMAAFQHTLQRLASLKLVRAKFEFLNGNEGNAYKQIIMNLEFSKKILRSGSGTPGFISSFTINRYSHQLLREISNRSTNSELIHSVISKLQSPDNNSELLENLTKEDFGWQSKFLFEIDEGNWPISWGPALLALDNRITRIAGFDPDETRELLAEKNRDILEQRGKPFSEVSALPAPSSSSGFNVLSGNPLGRKLAGYFADGRSTLVLEFRKSIDLEATRLVLALRCYQLKHGDLPAKEDELVPEFISEIPLDEFDRKPMRYSKEKRVVYSVGEDLADSGGIDGRDIVYPLAISE